MGTLAGKLVLVAREVLLARTFGANDALDAFFLAYSMPQFVIAVLASSLPAALLPAFIAHRQGGRHQAANQLLSQITGFGFITLSMVAILAILSMSPVVAALTQGFDSDKQAATAAMARVMAVGLPLSGLARVWAGAANAVGKFFFPALATSAANIAVVVWLVFASAPTIFEVSAAVVLGMAMEAAAAGVALRRAGLRPRLALPRLTEQTQRILRQFLPLAAAAGLTSASLLIDLSMASALGAGSVAALNLGNRLALFITGIVSLTLSAALLPDMASMAARGAVRELRTVASRTGWIFGGLGLVVVAFTYPLSRQIAELAYLGGSFSFEELHLVAEVQALYLLQLPFFAMSVVGVRVLTALERGRVIAYIASANLIANVVGNAVLIRFLGIRGIALSTSIVYLFSTVCLFLALRVALRPPKSSRT